MKKTAVFLCDRKTNLACEIGQLIPSNDFNIVSWLIILGGHKNETVSISSNSLIMKVFIKKKKKNLLFQNASALQRFLTRMLSFVLLPTPFPSAHIHEMRKAAYAVALHPNEIHCQRDWFITVLVQWFNVVEEVCKKLVAAFQHTQSYNVVSPHVSNDVAGQALCPASKRRWERETVTAL